MKLDFSCTNRVYLPEHYEELLIAENKSHQVVAWRNDRVNASLTLLTTDEPVEAIVSSTDFLDEKGNVLSSSNIDANFQKYISTYTGSNWIPADPRPFKPGPPPQGNRKKYPDVIYGNRLTIEKQSIQPIWAAISIPSDAVAGVYTGFIVAKLSSGSVLKVTLMIEILDILLEETSDTDTSDYYLNLWQYPHAVAKYYGVEAFSPKHLAIMKQQMKPYMKAGGRVGTASIVEEPWHHQTYYDYPSMVKWEKKGNEWYFDFADFDKWVDFLLKDIGVSYVEAYTIVPWGNQIQYLDDGVVKTVQPKPGTKQWNDYWKPFMEAFVKHLEEKGWFHKLIVAMDERSLHEMNAALDLVKSITNRKGECLKVGGAFNTYDETIWDRLFNVTPHMGVLANGDISADHFREIARRRREEGKKTTVYTMIHDYPGMFAMSDPSEAAWTIWYTEYLGADGFLRWAYDAWVSNPLVDNAHPYFEAGDMYLVYPGEYDGVHTQVRTTARFERMGESVRNIRKLRQLGNIHKFYQEKSDRIVESVENFYGRASSNGIGTAGFMMLSRQMREAISEEVVRLESEVIALSREYLSGISSS